jgi:hypothetical protein
MNGQSVTSSTSLSQARSRSKDWTLYFDENSNYHYWYNSITQVSEWATESEIIHSNPGTECPTADSGSNPTSKPRSEHLTRSMGDDFIENFKFFPR